MATLASRGATILLLIVLTPLLFVGLGERLFGIYQLTQRISQFGGLASFGASTYLKIRLAESYADESFEDRRKAIGDCILQWGVLLPLLVVSTVLMYWLISGRATVSDSEALAVLGLLFLTPVAQVLSIGQVALFTHHLGYYGVPLWTAIGVCASAAAAGAAYAGYGIEGVAIALAAGTGLNGLTSLALAKRMLPWFGLNWPTRTEFWHHLGKSFSVSIASAVYFGLQQLEALAFGLGAGSVVLARLVLTVIGVQVLDILVRSFIKTGTYAIAPFVRSRDSTRVSALREEAHGNIIALFAIAAPIIIALTPIVVPVWIEGAILLSPWIAASILLLAMFRLLAQFDAGLLDQARDFQWKNAVAGVTVFIPSATVGLLVYNRAAPDGWFWLLTAVMGLYFLLVAWRCDRILSVGTAWSPLLVPAATVVTSAYMTSTLVGVPANALPLAAWGAGLSFLAGALSLAHPHLRGPVRKLLLRLVRAARRTT
jgi:hypothetical protein